MTNSWDEMRKAKEESYFDKKNRESLERLATRNTDKPRLSPVTGEPMEHVTIHGVIVDRCPKSGGIWLDAGELEHLLNVGKDAPRAQSGEEVSDHWFDGFIRSLAGLKK